MLAGCSNNVCLHEGKTLCSYKSLETCCFLYFLNVSGDRLSFLVSRVRSLPPSSPISSQSRVTCGRRSRIPERLCTRDDLPREAGGRRPPELFLLHRVTDGIAPDAWNFLIGSLRFRQGPVSSLSPWGGKKGLCLVAIVSSPLGPAG